MNDSAKKKPLDSDTIRAALVGILMLALPMLGIDFGVEEIEKFNEAYAHVVALVAFVGTIYGRWKADRMVGF